MIPSVFGGIHDFFNSAAWDAIRALAVALVVVFWAATVYWVWKDASRRIASRPLVSLVTLLGAVPPFIGPLIYMLFRPPEYLDDVRERDLEIRAIERRLSAGECRVCHAEVEPDFLVCPVCSTRLRTACSNCQRPLEPAWKVCPYCEKPVIEDTRVIEADEPWPLRAEVAPHAPRTPRTR